ncbi:MAG: LLM class flavin-dependent oxidoreductase [Acetobacteraceae bacterium]
MSQSSHGGLPLDPHLRIGIQTIHRRTEPADGPWMPTIDEMVALVELVDRSGYDSLWVGDHVSFAVPILDPLLQLAQAAVASRRLTLGTGVYLLPLRHPAPVAKQVATLDHLTEGRLIFGVGVGGEFPREYEVCGVPREERGARLSEGVALLRRFWSGETVTHSGRFYGPFTDVPMLPPARQPGGPPIWSAGRADGALRRTGRMMDGWLSYVVTPEMYRASLDKIAAAAQQAERSLTRFGTGHLLFTRIDDSYEAALDAATETLSVRYAMDFRRAAQRYCALGRPEQVAERIREFHAAGVRHIALDLLGPYEQRNQQIERFAAEAMPLLRDLMTT